MRQNLSKCKHGVHDEYLKHWNYLNEEKGLKDMFVQDVIYYIRDVFLN